MRAVEQQTIFDGWMAAHQGILMKVARAYGDSHADREDLFQDISIQLWHSADAFRGDCAATTWIYRVALNTAIAWTRRERRHGHAREDLDDAAALLVAAPARDPRLDWIYARIAELDEVNRSLALLMLDGFSYRDMSQILGLSEGAIGVRITRIKAALVARLSQEEDA